MKNLIEKQVKENLLNQLRAYNYELKSIDGDYISTEAYNGVDHAFLYQMIRSIREILENKSFGGNNAIFFATNNSNKRIKKSNIIAFLENEISIVQKITNELSDAKLKQYAEEFSARVMQLKA